MKQRTLRLVGSMVWVTLICRRTMERLDKLEKLIQELTLKVQTLESDLENLKNGEFGTGVYLEGCNEEDAAYIKPNYNKKDGK